MKPESKSYTTTIGGLPVTIETGKVAGQAGGAVTLRVGDTLVFASATMSSEPRPGINFFPLSVDFEERMYAGGRIPGGFFRREGRPSEHAILTVADHLRLSPLSNPSKNNTLASRAPRSRAPMTGRTLDR